jgi:glycosyltransferase involved in cell wall biosynthesis
MLEQTGEGMTPDSAGRVQGVSIIVPTYNRCRLLPQSLQTLLAQTVPPLEVIVIDDGSSDDTERVIAALQGPIRYVKKVNGGKSSAVNLGLELARGTLIWLFDDDDWAEPDAIERRLRVLQAQPQLGFVGAGHFMGHAGECGEKVVEHQRRMPQYPPEQIRLRLFEDCYFSLCSVLAHRACFDAVGGFDLALKSSEDYDVLLRLASQFEFLVLDEPVFTVRQHAGIRGAGDVAYEAHQRREVFRKTDRLIGLKLRAALPLSAYVLTGAQPSALTQDLTMLALANRAVVMASKGLMDEMFEDLRALAGHGHLGADVLRRVQDALMCDYAFDAVLGMGKAFVSQWRTLSLLGRSGQALAARLRYALWRLARMRSAIPWRERVAKLRVWVSLLAASMR